MTTNKKIHNNAIFCWGRLPGIRPLTRVGLPSFVLFFEALGMLPTGVSAQDHPPLVKAIIMHNVSAYGVVPIILVDDPSKGRPGVINLPLWLLQLEYTDNEAAALVAAIEAYAQPAPQPAKHSQVPDPATRFERRMVALATCPAALASVAVKIQDRAPESDLDLLLRAARFDRPEFVAMPRSDCGDR